MSDEVIRGSGNVFADLGLPDADGEMLKVDLAIAIKRAIQERGLTQVQAAAVMGESQPNVSMIVGGKLSAFSTERLMRLLAALGKNLTITVSDAPTGQTRGQMRVSA